MELIGAVANVGMVILYGYFMHELAHLATCACLGVRVKDVIVSPLGVGIVRANGTPYQNFVISGAGPLMSLLLAGMYWPSAIGVEWNLALFITSILPVNGADGGRMWEALKQQMKLWGMLNA